MERQCSAIKPNGYRCRLLTEDPSGLCYSHNPKHAEQRVRRASRGGRSKAGKETANLKSELKNLRQRVDTGELETNKANTIIRAIATEVDIVRLERQVHLEDELAVELEALKRERTHPA